MEGKYKAELSAKNTQIVRYEREMNRLFDIIERQTTVQQTMAERDAAKYNLPNAQIYGFAPETTGGSQVSGEVVQDNEAAGTQNKPRPF